jgi:alpha-ketoglutarate-dependent taurine dioxygenase
MRLFFTDFETRGFICFKGPLPPNSTLDVAMNIGEVLNANGLIPVTALTPKHSEGLAQSSYSGMYGIDCFPPHTDLAHWYIPPRYILLRCMKAGEGVHTTFIRAGDLFGHETDITIKRAIFRSRRRLDERLTCFRLRQGECYRWDSVFIQPVNVLAAELRSRIMMQIDSANVQSVFLSDPGDCVLIDNWKVLHGRSAIPPAAMHRCVERVYITSLK